MQRPADANMVSSYFFLELCADLVKLCNRCRQYQASFLLLDVGSEFSVQLAFSQIVYILDEGCLHLGTIYHKRFLLDITYSFISSIVYTGTENTGVS